MRLTDFMRKIHDTPTLGVIVLTGGGTEAIGELLRHGNGSNTLLEAVVPYSTAALDDFLHGKPEKYCSESCARQLAMAAFQRATVLAGGGIPVFGLSATCSLVKKGERVGRQHRAFIGLQTANKTISQALELARSRSREEEEHVVAESILNMTAEACGLQDRLDTADDPNERREYLGTNQEFSLICGIVKSIHLPFRGECQDFIIFPGSFNPVHDGHRAVIKHATALTGKPVVAEISVKNVDKPMLDYREIHERCDSLRQEDCFIGVYLTSAPTFPEKADLFPNRTFLIGFDTLVRIADPRYYGGEEARNKALKHLADRGTKFLAYRRKGTTFED